MKINGQAATNPGCSIASNGIINGKINPQKEIITNSTHCIFPFHAQRNEEVAPVQLAGDQNEYSYATGVFTFTRTTLSSKQEKGRAEMNFCFTKPNRLINIVIMLFMIHLEVRKGSITCI